MTRIDGRRKPDFAWPEWPPPDTGVCPAPAHRGEPPHLPPHLPQGRPPALTTPTSNRPACSARNTTDSIGPPAPHAGTPAAPRPAVQRPSERASGTAPARRVRTVDTARAAAAGATPSTQRAGDDTTSPTTALRVDLQERLQELDHGSDPGVGQGHGHDDIGPAQ